MRDVIEHRAQCVSDAQALADFYQSNHAHLSVWEPKRPEGFHSLARWQQRLEQFELEKLAHQSAHFLAFCHQTQQVAAVCSLTNIQFGNINAANMGYATAKSFEGKSIMRALCQHVIQFAFDELALTSVMAEYIPRNYRSASLLERLGFEKEGIAKNYLEVNGKWEDHMLVSLFGTSPTEVALIPKAIEF